ncbi:MAG: WD40/YVTN/BNR-like repeat-containing protein, partial [Bacteroidota bacterium]
MKHILLFVCALTTLQAQWKYTGITADRGVIALHPSDSLTVFAAGYVGGKIGVYKSTDGGENWSFSSQGLLFQYLRKILVDPNNPEVMYVAGQSLAMGIAKSTDGGITWIKSDSGLAIDHHGYTVSDIALDAKRNILYAADWTIGGGIYRSTDGGRYWKQIRSEFVNPFFANGLFADSTDGSLYAWERSLWVSADSAATWDNLGEKLPEGIGDFALCLGYNKMYVIAGYRLFSKSSDGAEWFPISHPLLSDKRIGGIEINPRDSSTLYVGCIWTPFGSPTGGILRSTDTGMSWEIFSSGIPGNPDSIDVSGLK